ncbi:MAG: hypothetical protein JXQ73_32320 [Phycisphaerae bacterium]|nr:hypothetical protein [Phycisphaerae bacterium]
MQAMTSRERLMTAYRGGRPDRVPIRIWGVVPEKIPPHPSFQPICDLSARTDLVGDWEPKNSGVFGTASEAVSVKTFERACEVQGHKEVVTVVKTPAGELRSVYYQPLEPGLPGYQKEYLISSAEDAKRYLSMPYVPPAIDCSDFAAADAAMGDRGVVMAPLGPEPMYHMNALIGSELWAIWLIEERELLHELVRKTFVSTRDFLKQQLAAGVGPLFGYVGPELCIPPLASPRDCRDFVVAYDKPLIDLIHEAGGTCWMHCHGKMGPVIEMFAEMGVDALNPIEPPPMGDIALAEAKARVGGRMALEGNVEQGEFYRVTPEKMDELVRAAIHQGAPGGGFILCPTSSPWQSATVDQQTVDNYVAFVDAGRRYGAYPIEV